jgi:aminomethyltransferase
MGYPLYGHELDENTSAIEAGLGAFVATQKPGFIGKEQLAQQKAQGVSRRCVAFKMVDRSPPPRHGYPVHVPNSTDDPVGSVTSGTLSPCLNTGIGLAYVPTELSQPGTPIEIEIRNRRFPAITARKPLYHKPV